MCSSPRFTVCKHQSPSNKRREGAGEGKAEEGTATGRGAKEGTRQMMDRDGRASNRGSWRPMGIEEQKNVH